jgi:hypothetical protein
MTITLRSRGRLRGTGFVAALIVLVFVATMTPASATTIARGKIVLRSIGFSPTHVDASAGGATVDLTWTVADSTPGATNVSGTVYLRREGPAPGTFTGPTHSITYALDGSGQAQPISGDITRSTYRYAFPVPQYSSGTQSRFAVVKLTASDDKGTELVLQGWQLAKYRARFTATTAVDNTPPILTFGIRITPATPSAVYNRDQAAEISYSFEPADSESGLDRGRLVLAGPGGASAAAEFSGDPSGENPQCWPDRQSPVCTVKVTIPSDAPEGTWRVGALSLTDAAGNTADIADLDEAPAIVTGNRQLQATDVAVSPAFVNNWREDQVVQLTLTPSAPLSSVVLDLQGVCSAPSTTPVPGENGAVSIPITVLQLADSCRVAGIRLTSEDGHFALYGEPFGAPALDLLVRRVPNTTPPVVTSARLVHTEMTSMPSSQHNSVIANVETPVGITSYFVTLFDSEGASAGGGSGGVSQGPDNVVDLSFSIAAGMTPGTYTVAFMVFDASGLRAQYGFPGGPPVPGGPLTLTVLPGTE